MYLPNKVYAALHVPRHTSVSTPGRFGPAGRVVEATAHLLLGQGARLDLKDTFSQGTPEGWASPGGKTRIADYIRAQMEQMGKHLEAGVALMPCLELTDADNMDLKPIPSGSSGNRGKAPSRSGLPVHPRMVSVRRLDFRAPQQGSVAVYWQRRIGRRRVRGEGRAYRWECYSQFRDESSFFACYADARQC
jgi:hypothetical protein